VLSQLTLKKGLAKCFGKKNLQKNILAPGINFGKKNGKNLTRKFFRVSENTTLQIVLGKWENRNLPNTIEFQKTPLYEICVTVNIYVTVNVYYSSC
jgi:hypothetical protein